MPALKKRNEAKTLMITGGASGIGAAIAMLAAGRGHRVAVADIDIGGARTVAKKIGKHALAVELDIRSESNWTEAFDSVWKSFGNLDVLINNAAIAYPGNAARVLLDEHVTTVETDFLGPLKGMLIALPRFKSQGHGHFVTVCSMTAFLPFPGLSSYAAAKHALRAFHHAIALEERTSGLDFTIIHPGATETPMLDLEAKFDDLALAFAGPSMPAESVADIVLDAMEKRTCEVLIPEDRGKMITQVGIDPIALRKLVIEGEKVGLQNLTERRRAAQARSSAASESQEEMR